MTRALQHRPRYRVFYAAAVDPHGLPVDIQAVSMASWTTFDGAFDYLKTLPPPHGTVGVVVKLSSPFVEGQRKGSLRELAFGEEPEAAGEAEEAA